jgi:hypothetical protein
MFDKVGLSVSFVDVIMGLATVALCDEDAEVSKAYSTFVSHNSGEFFDLLLTLIAQHIEQDFDAFRRIGAFYQYLRWHGEIQVEAFPWSICTVLRI